MGFFDWLFPTAYAPDLEMASQMGLNSNNSSCSEPVETCTNAQNTQAVPVEYPETTNKPSKIQAKWKSDITISDCSTYSSLGIKRDYIYNKKKNSKPYEFDEKEAKNDNKLINGVLIGNKIQITKTWRLLITSEHTSFTGKIFPSNPLYEPNNGLEVIDFSQKNVSITSDKNKTFEISIDLKIPTTPGYYKRNFSLIDNEGNTICDKLFVSLRIVPHTINSPLQGLLVYGTLSAPKAIEKTHGKDTFVFSNWGLLGYNRYGEKIAGTNYETTHQYHDRHAWDANRYDDDKNPSDRDALVFPISRGKVKQVEKDYGAIYIHHDFIEGNEAVTGFVAVYMHMNSSSWDKSSNSSSYWEEGATVDPNISIGKIAGRGPSGNNAYGDHLHFAIYPLTCPEQEAWSPWTAPSVYAEILERGVASNIISSKPQERNILVKTVTGPSSAKVGEEVLYEATTFNLNDPTPEEKKKIKWSIKNNDGKEVIIDNSIKNGAFFKFTIPKSLDKKTIRVHPYANSPSNTVKVVTKIGEFWTLSKKGIETLKEYESLRLKPYNDQNGETISEYTENATIGYGYLIPQNQWNTYKNGITESDAENLFKEKLTSFEDAVNSSITADIKQHQFDALVMLAYNIGTGGFKGSYVVNYINDPNFSNPDYPTLEDAWKAWKKSNGKVMQGLVNRRNKEWNIYSNGY